MADTTENNLTTTARVASKSILGIKIKDPADATKTVTRVPDANGAIDLSDLNGGGSSKAIAVGDKVLRPTCNISDYQNSTKDFTGELIGVGPDASKLPNGITVTFADVPAPVMVGTNLDPCEVKFSSLISRAVDSTVKPDKTGFENLTSAGVKFSKAQIQTAIAGHPSYNFDFSSGGGSFMYIDPSSPDSKVFKPASAVFQIAFLVSGDTLTIDTTFNVTGNTAADGVAHILIDSITAY